MQGTRPAALLLVEEGGVRRDQVQLGRGLFVPLYLEHEADLCLRYGTVAVGVRGSLDGPRDDQHIEPGRHLGYHHYVAQRRPSRQYWAGCPPEAQS